MDQRVWCIAQFKLQLGTALLADWANESASASDSRDKLRLSQKANQLDAVVKAGLATGAPELGPSEIVRDEAEFAYDLLKQLLPRRSKLRSASEALQRLEGRTVPLTDSNRAPEMEQVRLRFKQGAIAELSCEFKGVNVDPRGIADVMAGSRCGCTATVARKKRLRKNTRFKHDRTTATLGIALCESLRLNPPDSERIKYQVSALTKRGYPTIAMYHLLLLATEIDAPVVYEFGPV